MADSISGSPSQDGLEDTDDIDYEDQSVIDESIDEFDDADVGDSPPPTRSYDPNAALGNLQWDEDLTPGPSGAAGDTRSGQPVFLPVPPRPIRQTTSNTIVASPRNDAREDTPLLHKATSLTFAEPPRPAPTGEGVLTPIAMPADGPPATLTRRVSQVSTRSGVRRGSTASRVTKAVQAGQSTFGQTVSTMEEDTHIFADALRSYSMPLQFCLV